MLITHGHQFDGSMHGARWLSVIGSVGYSAALRVNLWYNRERIGIDFARSALRACISNANSNPQFII